MKNYKKKKIKFALSKKPFEGFIKKFEKLKDNDIYNYNDIKEYNELFTCLNEMEEAIEFLFVKIGQDISYINDRIQPSEKRISIHII